MNKPKNIDSCAAIYILWIRYPSLGSVKSPTIATLLKMHLAHLQQYGPLMAGPPGIPGNPAVFKFRQEFQGIFNFQLF